MTSKNEDPKDICPIQLYHFGEPLLATIINECGLDSFIEFLNSDSAFLPDGDKVRKAEIIKSFRGDIISNFEVKTLIDISSTENLKFDSEHTIDVSITGKSDQNEFKIIPIEVKMGLTGVAESWPKFARGMNDRRIEEIEIKGNSKEKRLKGSMASMLAKFGVHGETLVASDANQTYSWSYWVLCIRLKNKEDFIGKFNNLAGVPVEACPLIFCFEELVGKLAPTSYQKKINDILNESGATLIKQIDESLKLIEK